MDLTALGLATFVAVAADNVVIGFWVALTLVLPAPLAGLYAPEPEAADGAEAGSVSRGVRWLAHVVTEEVSNRMAMKNLDQSERESRSGTVTGMEPEPRSFDPAARRDYPL